MGGLVLGTEVSRPPDTWAALAEHLLPGAFGMAFASARGFHRLAVAIEDAGLVIHPSIFGWAYGSGFPKATRIDTQIDSRGGQNIGWFGKFLREWRQKRGIPQKELAKHFPSKTGGLTGCVANWELGFNMPTVDQYNKLVEILDLPIKTLEAAEREVIGNSDNGIAGGKHEHAGQAGSWGFDGEYDITAPATPLASPSQGHRYGLQALKPALEPIIVFQKPYEGKPQENITRTGAGVLNVDGGTIILAK